MDRRGGVAAGNPDANPTETTYDAAPPSSTYHGPTVGGSEGGFIGLVTGLGIFLIIAGSAVWLFLRWRRRARSRLAREEGAPGAGTGLSASRASRGWKRAAGGEYEAQESDAFEMPGYHGGLESTADLEGGDPFRPGSMGRKWLNPSTLSLDDATESTTDFRKPHDSFRDEDDPFRDHETPTSGR